MNRTRLTTTSPKLAERVLESNLADLERQSERLAQKIQHTSKSVADIADKVRAPARKLEEIKQDPAPYLIVWNGALLLYIFARFLRS